MFSSQLEKLSSLLIWIKNEKLKYKNITFKTCKESWYTYKIWIQSLCPVKLPVDEKW